MTTASVCFLIIHLLHWMSGSKQTVRGGVRLDDLEEIVYNIVEKGVLFMDVGRYYGIR